MGPPANTGGERQPGASREKAGGVSGKGKVSLPGYGTTMQGQLLTAQALLMAAAGRSEGRERGGTAALSYTRAAEYCLERR